MKLSEVTTTEERFELWMNQIDEICCNQLGVGVMDLPDYCWRDLFDDELSPIEAYDCWIEDPDYSPLAGF